jgi:ATP-dependent DNA helicase DinG
VYPDEFTAVLVKGRSNYLCQRRLEQARMRQGYFFDDQRQLDSLWMIEEWAQDTTDGSLGTRSAPSTGTASGKSASSSSTASGRRASAACRAGTS